MFKNSSTVVTKKNTILKKVNTVLTMENTVLMKVNRVLIKENTVLMKVNTVDCLKIPALKSRAVWGGGGWGVSTAGVVWGAPAKSSALYNMCLRYIKCWKRPS
jgi:hypothetical protein